MLQSIRRVLGMPGRVAVTCVVSLSVSAGLFLPLGPIAYAKPANGGDSAIVEETRAEPTQLAISLQGEAQSGVDITVPDRAKVSASATLTGTNASTARGTFSYAIYSDSGCTNEVAWSGPRLVRQSTESRGVRLTPGTYYWQASYSGDAKDLPSVSGCGSAIETVDGSDPPPACTHVDGEMRLASEEGHLIVRNDLTTDLEAPQRLLAWWSGGHRLRLTRLLDASCVARNAGSHFVGVGEARLDGKPGYAVQFNIRIAKNGEEAVHVHVRNTSREPVLNLTGFPALGSETIG